MLDAGEQLGIGNPFEASHFEILFGCPDEVWSTLNIEDICVEEGFESQFEETSVATQWFDQPITMEVSDLCSN